MPRITYSPHALDVLASRGVSQEWVEATIRHPASTEQDPSDPERVRAFRSTPERDGRVLRVVYVPDGGALRVITAHFDRGRRRRAVQV